MDNLVLNPQLDHQDNLLVSRLANRVINHHLTHPLLLRDSPACNLPDSRHYDRVVNQLTIHQDSQLVSRQRCHQTNRLANQATSLLGNRRLSLRGSHRGFRLANPVVNRRVNHHVVLYRNHQASPVVNRLVNLVLHHVLNRQVSPPLILR